MKSQNSHHKRNISHVSQDYPSPPHDHMDEETSRKAFEEKWLANPRCDTKFENFTSLEVLSDGFSDLVTFGGILAPVIKVKHDSSDKFYAMKVFDKHTVVKKKMEKRMVREKRLHQALSHPFILGLDFHFKDNGYLYFVEEYLPGTLPPERTQPQKLCTANFSSGTLKTLINRLLRLKNKIF